MTKLCTCYMLNFLFYVQFDQFDEAKQRINIPCIIQVLFYHKCSFLQNHYRTINQTPISLHSIYRLFIKWYPNHDVQHCSQKFVSSEKLQIGYIQTFQRSIEVDFEHILDLYNSLERKTVALYAEIMILSSLKSQRIIINAAKFARQNLVFRVIHDKYGSLLVNAGELVCIVKSNMYY